MSHSSVTSTSSRPEWMVPLGLLLATGALLGVSTNVAKLAPQVGLSSLAFLTWSVTGAAVVLISVGAIGRRLPPLTARTIEYFAVAGLVSVAAPNLLFFAAIPHVGAAFVALAIAFPPLVTYLGALLLGLERFHIRRALGVVLALGGAMLLAVLKFADPVVDPVWVSGTLCGPLLLAVGNLYRTFRWPTGATPDMLAPGMLGASSLLLLGIGSLVWLLEGPLPGFSLAVPLDRATPLLLILVQVVIFTVQYLLFFRLQERGGPVYLSLLGSVGAVVGVPLAVAVLGEEVPRGLAISGSLIALGIGVLTWNRVPAR